MARQIQTVTYDDLGNGIDRRVGIISRAANKFYDIENYLTTQGRKLVRRPPLNKGAGRIDNVRTQGARFLNGKIVTVAPVGTVPNHTLTAYPVETIYFDPPELASGDWRLLDLRLFNEKAVALIQHRFDSAAAPWRTFLHVWDDKRPTYVEDPACPTNWTESLPLHAYGEGKVGAYTDFEPVITIGDDRIYLSTPNGNLAFCGVGAPRIWNTRAPEDILADGRWWYWISTASPGDTVLTLPVPYYDLVQDQRYAAYVLEYCTSKGEWRQLTETPEPLTALGQYAIEPVPNRYKTTDPQETRITYRKPGDGLVFRFRVCAKPPTILQTGLYLVPDGKVVGGVLSHEGASQQRPTNDLSILPLVGAMDYMIAVPVDGAPIPVSAVTEAPPGVMQLNGQERYWCRIIANARTAPVLPATPTFLYNLTGTAFTVVANSNRLSGTGSLFLTELEVGRQVEVNGERRVIKTILSDTQVETDAPFTAAYAGNYALRDIRYRYAYEVGDSGNAWYAERSAEASFELAGKDDAGIIGTATYENTGARILAVAPLQNRIIVQFPSCMQAWSTGPDSARDMRLLSIDAQASGIHTRPQPVLLDGFSVLPTVNGVRLFSPTGNSKDYIDFVGAGDMLRGIPLPDLTRAVWWPTMRSMVTCTDHDEERDLVFFVLTRHQDTKVLAWQRFTFRGIRRVDSFFVAGDRLCFVNDGEVFYLDPEATIFRDVTDPAGGPAYASRARWIYTDLGNPSKNKQLINAEVYQTGVSTLRVFMNPTKPEEQVPGSADIEGQTLGQMRYAIACEGPGIGVEIETTDESGHQLDGMGFDYFLVNR